VQVVVAQVLVAVTPQLTSLTTRITTPIQGIAVVAEEAEGVQVLPFQVRPFLLPLVK
jgi:hypothetical protein